MNWLTLILISATSFSVTTLLQRALLKEEQSDPVAYGFVFQILVSFLLFIYTQINGIGLVLPPLTPFIPLLISMSLLYALANLSLFKAFQLVGASEVAVITASKSMWTVISAVFLLGERITTQTLFGTALVILGVMVISWKQKKLKLTKGHLLALLAAVFFGFGFTNDARLLNDFDVSSYMVLAFFLPSVTILMFRPKSIPKLKLFMSKDRLLKMLATSFFYGIASLTLGMAYQSGRNASQIAPISQSSTVLTVILAYLFLKEGDNMLNKIVGALLVFAGVVFLKG